MNTYIYTYIYIYVYIHIYTYIFEGKWCRGRLSRCILE